LKICLFSHYSEKEIPNYVFYYLEKLSQIVDKIILLTNKREISNIDLLSTINVSYKLYENSGWDFGMYYKYFKEHPEDIYEELFLVNDSMVAFNSLFIINDWLSKSDADMKGLIDSSEINYHLQSYFLVLNEEAQILFKSYLNNFGIIEDFGETIRTYEVGFSQFLLKNGYKIESMYNYKDYMSKNKTNISIHAAENLIKNGFPLIKKKVLFNTFNKHEMKFIKYLGYDFNIDYKSILKEYKEDTLNTNYLFSSLNAAL
jgi:lipopolysaccharide biosynthesis protein